MLVRHLIVGTVIALSGMPSQAGTSTDVVCSYAPSQSAVVNRITGGIGGAGAGAAAIMQAYGLTAVLHSSGAYIFTGAGGYVAGTLGAAIFAPILITTSVVIAGSTIILEDSNISCLTSGLWRHRLILFKLGLISPLPDI